MLKNPKVKCPTCNGHGKICYDDAIGITMPCGTCGGAKALALNGAQLASSLPLIKVWLGLTGNQLRLRKRKGEKCEAEIFNQGRIGLGTGDTLDEALAKAFDSAIEFMNEEGVDATA